MSVVTDIVNSTASPYWTARCRMEVLNQRDWWVPAAAWRGFAAASLRCVTTQEVVGEIDGTPATVGPLRGYLYCSADFTVDGVVAVDDMGIRWRHNVLAFLWNRWARQICTGLSYETLHLRDPFGDIGDDVFAELAEHEDRFIDMVGNDTARRVWFESLPLVETLRASIIYDRDVAGSAVLLGGGPAELIAGNIDAELVISDGNCDPYDAVIDSHLVELDRDRALGRR